MEYLQPVNLIYRIVCLLAFAISISQQTTKYGSRSDLAKGPSYFFYQLPKYPRDCQEVISQCLAGNTITSGVHLIKPDGYPEPFEVFCDNSIGLKGWMVIHRRLHGSIDFGRKWIDYEKGFGFLGSEFWLGNEKVSFITNQKTYELQIDMTNAAGSSFFLHYDMFRISDGWGEFKLLGLGEYSSNASTVEAYCPINMEYGSCSCQTTYSGGCQNNCIDGEETCVCQNGFFLDQDSNCVSEEKCRCYIAGLGVIQEGDSQVTDCSIRCSCNNNQLNCVNFQCSADATCLEVAGGGRCQCKVGFEGDGITCTRLVTTPPTTIDCFDLYNAGNTADDVYTISAAGTQFQVYCDMTTDGGGWTVFQRRVDGSESFYRDWDTYKAGLGPLRGEHWLGNEKLHLITGLKDYQLRIDILDTEGSSYIALYDSLHIDTEINNYRLWYNSYSGSACLYINTSSTS